MKNARILVVDDNAENRALAQATLEDEGCVVLLASSGEEGLRLFEAERPDCILLDVRMPGTDGFEVCSRIRGLPDGAHVPVIFLTALRDVDTFDRALRSGGDDFLTKPVRPTELVIRIQAALKLSRMGTELREHYDLVRQQRDQLMRLQLQQAELTAFVVHDLKNPVNSMDLHAQLLLRSRDLPEAARSSAQHIRNEARNLLRLILNLLDISKGDEGALVPRIVEVALGKLVEEVVDELALRAKDSGVTIERSIEVPTMRADLDLLRRVLENLLENAIRHAPEHSVVRLVGQKADGAIELRLTDAGAGVPLEMREKIFERFVQVEKSASVTRGGRGLGLAFCKTAVEAHGGRIWVEAGNPGAVFCVRLPHVD